MPDNITNLASRLKPIITKWINDAIGSGGGGSTPAAGSYVPTTRRIVSGDGLIGGGVLTDDITLHVGAGDGIDVAADTVAVDVTDIIDTGYGLVEDSNNIRIDLSAISGLTFDSGDLELDDTIAGSGLVISNKILAVGAGDGITVNEDDVAITTPGNLSEATTNVSAGNHTHNILSSSDPGTSSSLLHSGSVGALTLVRLNVDDIYDKSGGDVTFYATASLVADKNFVPSITASRHLGSSGRLWDEIWTNKTYFGTTGLLQNAGTDIIGLGTGDSLRSSDYVSNVAGWAIESDGSAEFLNMNVRGEIHSAVFVKDLIDARAGTMLVAKSAGVITTLGASVPISGAWDVYIKDPPTGGFLFEDNDICRVRAHTATGVSETWFRVYGKTDIGDGTQAYSCATCSGASGLIYPEGSTIIDYGVSGDGFCTMTAELTGAPYYDVSTWTASPWTAFTLRARVGNLTGITDPAVSPSGFGIYTDNAYIKGTVSAACGNVFIDDTGITVSACDGDIWDTDNFAKWNTAGSTIGEVGVIRGTNYGADAGTAILAGYGNRGATDRGIVHLRAISGSWTTVPFTPDDWDSTAEIRIFTDSTASDAGYIKLINHISATLTRELHVDYDGVTVHGESACQDGLGVFNGALLVGGTAESIKGVYDLGTGDAAFTGGVAILEGLYVGATAGQSANDDALIVAGSAAIGAGLYVGDKTVTPTDNTIGVADYMYAYGGIHVGGNSDPGTDNLVIDGFLNLGTPSVLTISSGEITVTKSFHFIATEGGAASDDLTTINGGSEGDILVLCANDNTETVVVKDNATTLLLAGDCTLDHGYDSLTLINRSTNWLELSRSLNMV